jgi:hypothetical protein
MHSTEASAGTTTSGDRGQSRRALTHSTSVHLMYDFIDPMNKSAIRLSTGVPFIFSSMLSMRTRRNSCTSCCRKASIVVHPNDRVSSFVSTATWLVCSR